MNLKLHQTDPSPPRSILLADFFSSFPNSVAENFGPRLIKPLVRHSSNLLADNKEKHIGHAQLEQDLKLIFDQNLLNIQLGIHFGNVS